MDLGLIADESDPADWAQPPAPATSTSASVHAQAPPRRALPSTMEQQSPLTALLSPLPAPPAPPPVPATTATAHNPSTSQPQAQQQALPPPSSQPHEYQLPAISQQQQQPTRSLLNFLDRPPDVPRFAPPTVSQPHVGRAAGSAALEAPQFPAYDAHVDNFNLDPPAPTAPPVPALPHSSATVTALSGAALPHPTATATALSGAAAAPSLAPPAGPASVPASSSLLVDLAYSVLAQPSHPPPPPPHSAPPASTAHTAGGGAGVSATGTTSSYHHEIIFPQAQPPQPQPPQPHTNDHLTLPEIAVTGTTADSTARTAAGTGISPGLVTTATTSVIGTAAANALDHLGLLLPAIPYGRMRDNRNSLLVTSTHEDEREREQREQEREQRERTESRKRKRVPDAVAVKSEDRKPTTTETTDNEDNCCSICLEPWTASGKHQLCCLPCGHLFGRNCIEQWLKRKRVCPRCRHTVRGKVKATLIFAAPTKLAVIDHGELQTARDELAKEKQQHEATKKKLKSAERERDRLQKRMNRSTANTVQVYGGAALPPNAPQVSLVHLPFTHGINPTGQAQIPGTITASSNDVSLRSPTDAALGRMRSSFRLPEYNTQPMRSRPQSMAQAAQIAQPSAPSNAMQPLNTNNSSVAMMFSVSTNGGSKALAFDLEGNILYSEKRLSQMGGNVPQKVSRRPLSNHNMHLQSRVEFYNRINDISVCGVAASTLSGYIAVAAQNRQLTVLSPSLHSTATSYTTSNIPLTAWWPAAHPNVLIAGLMNGCLEAFDVRQTSQPFHSERLGLPGRPHALHSLAEVELPNTSQPILLAATPCTLHAVQFSGYNSAITTRNVATDNLNDQMCSSLAADGNTILLSSRSTDRMARHTVHLGLANSNPDGDLTLGPILANQPLTGNYVHMPFERAAILTRNNQHDGTVVLAPDTGGSNNGRYTRMWQYQHGNWGSQRIAFFQTYTSTAAIKALRLQRDGVTGVAAHLGDENLQVFSVR